MSQLIGLAATSDFPESCFTLRRADASNKRRADFLKITDFSVARAPKNSGPWSQLHRMLERRRQLRRREQVVSKARHVCRAPEHKIARLATVRVVLFYL